MSNPFSAPTAAALLTLATLVTPTLRAQAVADPTPAPLIPFQGRLLQNGVAATGDHAFVFTLITADTSGVETVHYNSGTVTLPVASGLYSVVLGGGAMPALPTDITGLSNLKVRVTIDGQAMTPDDVLEPEFQARAAWLVNGSFDGDVQGFQKTLTVAKLRGFDLAATAPATGQLLAFDGTKWTPTAASAIAGTQGAAGPAGTQGPAGPAGTQGPAGPAGTQGPAGPAGAQGPAGLAGAQGPAGLAGAAGATGPAGPVGPKGAAVLVSAYQANVLPLAPNKETTITFNQQLVAPAAGYTPANGTFVVPQSGIYQFSFSMNTTITTVNSGGVYTYPTHLQPRIKVTPSSGSPYTLLGPSEQFRPMTDVATPSLMVFFAHTGYFNAGDAVTFAAYLEDTNAQSTVSLPNATPALTILGF
jgi:hypothetical protein